MRTVFTLAAMIATSCIAPTPPPPEPAPDILYVQLDDTSIDSVTHYMPQTMQVMSGLHWFNFTQAVVPTPLCGPKRGSDLTGQTVDHHGLDCVEVTPEICARWAEVRPHTFTQALADVGYRIGWYGKRLNWSHECAVDDATAGYPNLPGVEDDRIHLTHSTPSGAELFDRYVLVENGVAVQYDTAVNGPGDYGTYKTADLAEGGITNLSSDGPFMVVWNPQASHLPGTPPPDFDAGDVVPGMVQWQPPFNEGESDAQDPDISDKPYLLQTQTVRLAKTQWKRSKYQETLQAVDNRLPAMIAQFLAMNPGRGKRIVVTSDHGQELGNHRHRVKQDPYEMSMRVPLFIYDDRFAGGVVGRAVNTMDVTGALLEWSGAAALPSMDAKSLVPLYTGTAPDWPTVTYASTFNTKEVLYDMRDWGMIRQDCTMHSPCYKLVKYPAGDRTLPDGSTISLPDEWELYDLTADPWELTNLLPNGFTGYAGQPGWDDSNPTVVELKAVLESRILNGA